MSGRGSLHWVYTHMLIRSATMLLRTCAAWILLGVAGSYQIMAASVGVKRVTGGPGGGHSNRGQKESGGGAREREEIERGSCSTWASRTTKRRMMGWGQVECGRGERGEGVQQNGKGEGRVRNQGLQMLAHSSTFVRTYPFMHSYTFVCTYAFAYLFVCKRV